MRMVRICKIGAVLLLLCLGALFAGCEARYDFRYANWGDSRENILERDREIDERFRDVKDIPVFWGKSEFNGYEARFTYSFAEGGRGFNGGCYTIDFDNEPAAGNCYEDIADYFVNQFGTAVDFVKEEDRGTEKKYFETAKTKVTVIKNIVDECNWYCVGIFYRPLSENE